MRWSIIIALPLISLCGGFQPQAGHAQDERAAPASRAIPSGLVWKEVASSAQVQILERLSAQTRSNYERIATWAATYSVHVETYLSPAFVKDAFAGRLPKDSTSALVQESEYSYKFAIQMETGSIFREQDTTRFRLLTTDSRKPMTIPRVQPVDNRSIVTAKKYVYFAPKEPRATYSVLPDHPEAQNKRAAHRVPLKKVRHNERGELMDPRVFFHCSTPSMSWMELDMYISALNGKDGAEKQRMAEERLKIAKATNAGSPWYRIQLVITFPNARDVLVTSVWSPLAGYNPVSLMFTARSQATGVARRSVSWQWKRVAGIFVPEFVREVLHPEKPGNIDTYKRIVKLKECSLNKPLDPKQFTYAALGLGEGDLVLDEVEKNVYIMHNGEPQRLAGFHEPYVAPQLSARKTTWFWPIVANVVFVIMLFLAYLARRRRAVKDE